MHDPIARAYREVPYTSDAQAATHPDRLATAARLHGLDPAPPARCRLLELGCGDGGNLLPMAAGLPDASFVGVDLADRAVAEGQRRAARLGLANVELRTADILELDEALGRFDYVVAHGVYSWVPEAVREHLLALCRRLLRPHGVAYVSYNALPGWHLFSASRAMMRYQMAHYDDSTRALQEARGLLALLLEAQIDDSPYRALLARETERLEAYPDWFLAHDHLAEHNRPFYFHEFAARARAYGLRYLAEADFEAMHTHGLAPWVDGVLDGLDDPVEREQYLDFFRGRRFRRTLLCHAERRPRHTAAPDDVARFLVAAPVRRLAERDGEGTHAGHRGRRVRADHPLTLAALDALAEAWPRRLPFEHLHAEVARRLAGSAPDDLDPMLRRLVFDLCRRGFARLHIWHPPLTTVVSERPEAAPAARLQIETDALVTSLGHESVPVEDEAARTLLPQIDGTRTVADLARATGLAPARVRQVLAALARAGLLRA